MIKKALTFALILCMICTCTLINPETVSAAAHKHRYSENYYIPNVKVKTRTAYECTSAKAIGSPITGGWIRKSDVQEVYYGESASDINGRSFSTVKTVSFNVTGSALKGALEAKLGCDKTWKKETFSARAKNSARNRTNKARYIAYCIQNTYQKYELKYKNMNQKYCYTCKRWITQSSKTCTAYAYKKASTNGAFFYADKKSSLTNEAKVCMYKDGIMYEDLGKEGRGYLASNGRVLTGFANKNDQNYNAFSNIKNWR